MTALHLVRLSVWVPKTRNSQNTQTPQAYTIKARTTFPKDGESITTHYDGAKSIGRRLPLDSTSTGFRPHA